MVRAVKLIIKGKEQNFIVGFNEKNNFVFHHIIYLAMMLIVISA